MVLLKRYLIVDSDAPASWDHESAIAFICVLSVGILGAIAAGIRLYGRIRLLKTLAWDDMLMLLATISSAAYTILALLQIRYGLVVPMQERPYELQQKFQEINYSARLFYLTGLTWFKLSLCVTCHRMSNGRLESKVAVIATFASCSAIGITTIITLLKAFPPGVVEGVTTQVSILLQLMYGLIAVTSTFFDIVCFSLPFLFLDNRYLSATQRNDRRGWMYVTFATTFTSIIRAFAIAPATSTFSTESEGLVIMGIIELNMGLISTSLPSWYMWMNISRTGKKRFRDYQPIKFLRKAVLPLIGPTQRWANEVYSNLVARIENKITMKMIIRQLQRLNALPFYQLLYWNTEANPTDKVLKQQSSLYQIGPRFRRWLGISVADILHRLKTLLGLNRGSFQAEEVELVSLKKESKRAKKGRPRSCHSPEIRGDKKHNEAKKNMRALLKQQRESFLTNRNYNILFTSDRTLMDMMHDAEREFVNNAQWSQFNEAKIDWTLRRDLASSRYRNLDGLLSGAYIIDRPDTGNVDKRLKGLRRRRGF